MRDLLDEDGRLYNAQYAEFREKVKNDLQAILIPKITCEKNDSLLQIFCLFENAEDFSICFKDM